MSESGGAAAADAPAAAAAGSAELQPAMPELARAPVKFSELMALVQTERKKTLVVTQERDRAAARNEALRVEQSALNRSLADARREIAALEQRLAQQGDKPAMRRIRSLENLVGDLNVKLELSRQDATDLRSNLAAANERVAAAETVALPEVGKDARIVELEEHNRELLGEIKSLRIAREKSLQQNQAALVAAANMDVIRVDLKRERAAHRKTTHELQQNRADLVAERSRAQKLEQDLGNVREQLAAAAVAGPAVGSQQLKPAVASAHHAPVGRSLFHRQDATVPDAVHRAVVEEKTRLEKFHRAHAEIARDLETAVRSNRLLLVSRQGAVVTTLRELKAEFEKLHDDRSEMERSWPLPAGWERAVDSAAGRVYYVDRLHMQTSWRHPAWQNGEASQFLFGRVAPAKYALGSVRPSSAILQGPVAVEATGGGSGDLAEMGLLTEQLLGAAHSSDHVAISMPAEPADSAAVPSSTRGSLSYLAAAASSAVLAPAKVVASFGNQLSLRTWLSDASPSSGKTHPQQQHLAQVPVL